MPTEDIVATIGCDVLVVGAGAGGLATAVTARKAGLDVLVVEKESTFGGTTALSGGWLWIPCNPLAVRAGIADSLAAARTYLEHDLGAQFDGPRIDAYLEHGPRMVEFFERETAVRFLLGTGYPDYHPALPGGATGGRAICAAPFDGRALGARLPQLRPPVREMTLFGLKVGSGPDFAHFFNARRSLRSALYVGSRIARHAADVARHGRDVLLMSGNALVARLARTAFDLEIPLLVSAPAVALVIEEGRVVGAHVRHDGLPVIVRARRGVVLAAGGFAHDRDRRKRLYAHAPEPDEHFSLAAPGNTGDGVRMAESAGGSVDEALVSAAPWMPVSRVPYRDGTYGTYPHSFERGKPGGIIVGANGRRFTNESDSYHDVVRAMIRAREPGRPAAAFLLGDARFVQRYGIGMAKPFPLPLRPFLRSGYLKRGRTIAELARECGIDPDALCATVADFNEHAARGEDPEFGRGTNAYNVYQGDPRNAPNPCLAPIETPPFYAVRMVPGDLGTFMGARTDATGAVLDGVGRPIPGLFAVGNDMASIFGGHYPGPGSNIGPAMTFGYLCARHLAATVTRP